MFYTLGVSVILFLMSAILMAGIMSNRIKWRGVLIIALIMNALSSAGLGACEEYYFFTEFSKTRFLVVGLVAFGINFIFADCISRIVEQKYKSLISEFKNSEYQININKNKATTHIGVHKQIKSEKDMIAGRKNKHMVDERKNIRSRKAMKNKSIIKHRAVMESRAPMKD